MKTIEQARVAALKLCNALRDKDWTGFKNCFNVDDPSWEFIDVLPGGKIVKSAQELIDLHPVFFNSADTKFHFNDFLYELDQNSVCQFGVVAEVTKPKELSDKLESENLELVTIKNILNFTYAFDDKSKNWWPISITNTVIKNDLY